MSYGSGSASLTLKKEDLAMSDEELDGMRVRAGRQPCAALYKATQRIARA